MINWMIDFAACQQLLGYLMLMSIFFQAIVCFQVNSEPFVKNYSFKETILNTNNSHIRYQVIIYAVHSIRYQTFLYRH